MKKKNKLIKIFSLVLLLLFSFSMVACGTGVNQTLKMESEVQEDEHQENLEKTIQEDGVYTSKEDVSLYIHHYDKLPSNYITKKQAQSLGWDNKKGNLWEVAEGKSIGGDRFGNREKLLPEAEGRIWTECDIDYSGGYRNEKRIVFSNDGLIYYTDDHYKSFEKLYEK